MRNKNEFEQYRIRDYSNNLLYDIPGYIGMYRVMVNGRAFNVLVSIDGGFVEHVSVTPKNPNGRLPSWDDMCKIKDIFFEDEEECYEVHPKKSEYVNMVDNCLHIWRDIT